MTPGRPAPALAPAADGARRALNTAEGGRGQSSGSGAGACPLGVGSTREGQVFPTEGAGPPGPKDPQKGVTLQARPGLPVAK